MIEHDITISNKLGLHARAAAKLVDCASAFASKIELQKESKSVDAKSIMSVMLLAAGQGTALRLRISGKDENAALDALCQLINNKFGEGE